MAKADVAELVDARDLKSLDGNVVWVRVPPPAPAFARARAKAVAPKPQGEGGPGSASPGPAGHCQGATRGAAWLARMRATLTSRCAPVPAGAQAGSRAR